MHSTLNEHIATLEKRIAVVRDELRSLEQQIGVLKRELRNEREVELASRFGRVLELRPKTRA